MSIRVRATAQGYHGQLREIDDVFDIQDEEAFSEKWMEKVDGSGRTVRRGAPATANSTGNNPAPKQPPRNPENDTLA